MIKKLKFKFMCIIMSLLSIVLIFIFGSINISMHNTAERQINMTMNKIADSDGRMRIKPPLPQGPQDFPNPIDMPKIKNNFSVKLDEENKILEIMTDMKSEYDEEDILKMTNDIISMDKTTDYISENIRFLMKDKPYGKIIVFYDDSIEKDMNKRLLIISMLIGSLSLIIIFFIALFLSNWAIKPVKDAFEKQKQFVGDASHELKTPLSVINANVDVLRINDSENKWLSYIKLECERMSRLVNDLLYLTKIDNLENTYLFSKFNLSDAITSACLPFESIAFEENKSLIFDIQEEVFFTGDESRIKQVVIILLDNAIKNSNLNANIEVTLKEFSNKIYISVFNTGIGISDEDKERIFQRFYRVDKSRARNTGGFGLGLSIAKSIVDNHKGRIFVESKLNEGAKFTVIL